MPEFVPNNTLIANHPWSEKYKVTLNDICARDYRGKRHFKVEYLALDVDAYETDRACANNDCTLDAAIGIDYLDRNEHLNSYLLLVELRLDYQSSDTLHYTNLYNKVAHTGQLLTAPTHTKKFFIFNMHVEPQARRKFSNWANEGKDSRNWVAKSPGTFEELFAVAFEPKQKYDGASIINSLTSCPTADALYAQLDYWKTELERLRTHFDQTSISHIQSHISTGLPQAIETLSPSLIDTTLLGLLLSDILSIHCL